MYGCKQVYTAMAIASLVPRLSVLYFSSSFPLLAVRNAGREPGNEARVEPPASCLCHVTTEAPVSFPELYRALFLSPVDEVLRTLGEGTFGKVVCCKDK